MRLLLIVLNFFVFMSMSALAQTNDITGNWNTSFGYATVKPIEGGYDVVYEEDSGRARLMYTVSGELEGIWSESSSNEKCEAPDPLTGSYYWGRVRGSSEPVGGFRLLLTWSYCGSEEYNRAWHFFTKIYNAKPPCCE